MEEQRADKNADMKEEQKTVWRLLMYISFLLICGTNLAMILFVVFSVHIGIIIGVAFGLMLLSVPIVLFIKPKDDSIENKSKAMKIVFNLLISITLVTVALYMTLTFCVNETAWAAMFVVLLIVGIVFFAWTKRYQVES